jgi:hypothetical protein
MNLQDVKRIVNFSRKTRKEVTVSETYELIEVKQPLYRPDCGPEGGTGIALLFQDLGARRG